AAVRLAAVVVGPDELVEEALATEERVEGDLGVVGLSVIEMEVEGAPRVEQAPRLGEARLEERPVVLEAVVVAVEGAHDGAVALAAEALAVALRIADGVDGAVPLGTAGVERGVEIDEAEAFG